MDKFAPSKTQKHVKKTGSDGETYTKMFQGFPSFENVQKTKLRQILFFVKEV